MNKFTFHIHLVNLPTKMSGKIKDQLDIIHLCDKIKGFSIIDAFLLRESLGDQMSLVAFKNTIRGKLGLIDPSKLHDIHSLGLGNNFPCLILLQGITFNI